MMRRSASLLTLCVLAGTSVLAQPLQGPNPVNPHPGGSPFPAGGEPSLTHTAKAFWTTQDGLVTQIRVSVDGDRATQFSCWKWSEGKRESLGSSIAPECRHHILISSTKVDAPEGGRSIVADGLGGLQVRVHGFKREDFGNPPLLIVTYLKHGKVVGETRVVAHPVPEKFKKAEAAAPAKDD